MYFSKLFLDFKNENVLQIFGPKGHDINKFMLNCSEDIRAKVCELLEEENSKMSEERNFNVNGNVVIHAGTVLSVEKGNVEKEEVAAASRVCAFTLQVDGSALPVKILLKGEMAINVYTSELRGYATMTSEANKVLVNVEGEIREVRPKEFVLHNIKSLEFFRARSYKR